MLLTRVPLWMSLPLLALLLVACESYESDNPTGSIFGNGGGSSAAKSDWSTVTTGQDGPLIAGATGWSPQAQLYEGTGQFVGSPSGTLTSSDGGATGPVTMNLVDVSIPQAAKAILGDTLGVNYFVDENVKGTVTIETSRPVSTEALLDIFETILRTKGATIVADAGFYRIMPAGEGGAAGATIQAGSTNLPSLGVQTRVVPLRYVSATEMERILQPIAAKGAVLRVDQARNMLMLQGTGKELANLLETVEIFDVDWMEGMSFALIPVEASNPEAIAAELESVFATDKDGPAKGVVRFIPNKRLNAVLAISPQEKYLRRATSWVKRLDKAAKGSEDQLYVYPIQNRPAAELAKVLQGVFEGEAEARVAPAKPVAPKFTETQLTSEEAGTAGTADPAAATDATVEATPDAAELLAESADTAASSGGKKIKIVADEANNSLLILASPRDYERVLKVLQRIDAQPNQVLLEATIAEVSLNDELKFGLRWYFERENDNVTLSDLATGLVAKQFPGFSYFLSLPHLDVALNALASITTVNVISTPTLMVLDNKTAVLQVGDQVPIATRSAVDPNSTNNTIVNSISFRDTGVILSVTPRVSDYGRVTLEIEQEVSNVVKTTTSGIDSPTIQQRKIKTTVAVDDGEALALGGLMQERTNKTSDQVPIAGDIPIFGTLFKNKGDDINRTELLIIIRPHVVRDVDEARWVTEEFKKHLNIDVRGYKKGKPTIRDNLVRVLQ